MVHAQRGEAGRPLEGLLHLVLVRDDFERRLRARYQCRVRHRIRGPLLPPPVHVHRRQTKVSPGFEPETLSLADRRA